MSEKFCTNCGGELSESQKFCVNCGTKVKKKKGYVFFWIIAAVVVIFILLIWAGSLEESSDTSKDNSRHPIVQNLQGNDSLETNPVIPTSVIAAVVNVWCPYYGEPMTFDSYGTGGSGTVISEEGTILTNSHIIPQDDETLDVNEEGCIIVFPDEATGLPREAYLAEPLVIQEISDTYDLALLLINDVYTDSEGEQYGEYPKNFYSISDENCNDEEIQLGEQVKIYGYPSVTGGYSLTVTEGVVSAFNDLGIVTSAKIEEGNSGGLATDRFGCFIGVPSAVSVGEAESYGLIIPPYQVEEFINEVASMADDVE